ncbi:hypothetical protein K9B33_05935 [Sphingobium sp. 3R8]|uniref:hypothetical protein n=1 Tax=Sphingobium sp. 3R8 TaxID=2874921 RepID=UPI001CCCBDD8|nr:hypothetical protein [Sphingobium sp. 3R8]MBZ9647074.1 hypothetical protein [Sphingobium sp. 3R8]
MSSVVTLRQRQSALHSEAPKVANKLRATEIAIDTSISHLAGLTAMLVDARVDAQLSAIYGQDALSSLGEALNTMIKGRASVVDAHSRLAGTGKQLRLDVSAFGGLEQKPAMP